MSFIVSLRTGSSNVGSDWILATGFWDDSAHWDDSEVWIDSPSFL